MNKPGQPWYVIKRCLKVGLVQNFQLTRKGVFLFQNNFVRKAQRNMLDKITYVTTEKQIAWTYLEVDQLFILTDCSVQPTDAMYHPSLMIIN